VISRCDRGLHSRLVRALMLCALAGLARDAAAQPGEAAAPASSLAAPAAVAAGADLALQALAYLGVPYRYGGEDPLRGFDCSGLVRHVARSVLQVDLPRRSEAIATQGRAVRKAELQVGDLVFFNTRGRRNSHVGFYLGEGRFVHAPARNGQVRIESIEDAYWRQRYNGARRLHDDPAPIERAVEPATTAVEAPATELPRRDPPPDVPGPHPAGGA
jgi:cell wall-associated NlpC family hydrolase